MCQNIIENDQLFQWRNLTDFEKNLFLKKQVQELQQEVKDRDFRIGELTSERDELIHENSTNPKWIKYRRLKEELKYTREKLVKYRDSYYELLHNINCDEK